MLVDDIRAGRLIKSAIGDAMHEKLCRDLESAQRFNLAEDFAEAATQISNTNMAAFKNAITACRAPFPRTWIEVAQAHRRNFVRDNSDVPMSEEVTRAGILIDQISDDGLAYKVSLFFRGEREPALSTISMLVDLRGEDNEARRARRLTATETEMVRKTLAEKYSGDNLDAAFEIETMTAPTGNDYTNDCVGRIIESLGEAKAKEAVAADQKNWDGELMFWLSALALLNTRNVGKNEIVDVSKVNRGRLKRGALPLLGYENCRIDQGRIRGNSTADNDNGPQGGKRAHFVRGHFKMRKTGVFWWRPAMRGNLSLGMKTKTYQVRHTQPAAQAA